VNEPWVSLFSVALERAGAPFPSPVSHESSEKHSFSCRYGQWGSPLSFHGSYELMMEVGESIINLLT